MNGGHDLGGKKGFGPIDPEPEASEPYFHADWERRVFALTIASGMLGRWNLDESRHARERQQPGDYLRNSYYENWLVGVEKLLVEKELLDQQELDSGLVASETISASETVASKTKTAPKLRVPDAQAVKKILSTGGPTLIETEQKPRFNIGDEVQLRGSQDLSHTRAPTYAVGAIGCVADHHGCHIFPDSNATGTRKAEHLYSVVFSAKALWGCTEENDSTEENSEVAIDLWEPYLDRAEAEAEVEDSEDE